MKSSVLLAVFKRNFVSYFTNPTGYVFLFLFVLLTGIAAFWPNEFFNSNLANLDQLNKWLPYILLIFIPAITMSIWAEERRLGTDELLLTIPATDVEVVAGKFLAAVAIYSASLAYSAACNLMMLEVLGSPDLGLFFGMYFGYWMVGVAMISIGMVASFLTGDLTVGFVLGCVFNAPLVFAAAANTIFPEWLAIHIQRLSIGWHFRDFQSGVISFSSMMYFILITAFCFYLCVVLIGRRHWLGGRDGRNLLPHYLTRTISLGAICVGVIVLSAFVTLRFDATAEGLNSLSPNTKQIASNLGYRFESLPQAYREQNADTLKKIDDAIQKYRDEHKRPPQTVEEFQQKILQPLGVTLPRLDDDEASVGYNPETGRVAVQRPRRVRIEAFVSPEDRTPETYITTRLNLLNTLREIEALRNPYIEIVINETRPASVEADRAQQLYNIEPRQVGVQRRGQLKLDELFMAVAFTSGLNKHVIPFVDRGIPIEYELARSVVTVCRDAEQTKTIGVVRTGAMLFPPQLPPQFGGQRPEKEMIIQELEKQYRVEEVDPSQPIKVEGTNGERYYAALLVVQPSTLDPKALDNVIDAIRQGVPTAIFEDPQPAMMRVAESPNAEHLEKLWKMLGVEFNSDEILWTHYNPHPKIEFPKEFVFIARGSGAKQPFDDNQAITSKLQEILFPFTGYLRRGKSTGPTYSPLLFTSSDTGTLRKEHLFSFNPQTFQRDWNQNRDQHYSQAERPTEYAIAARIHGPLDAEAIAELDKDKQNTPQGGDQNQPGANEGAQSNGQGGVADLVRLVNHPGHDGHEHDEDGNHKDDKPSKDEKREVIDVVVVADLDCLTSVFFDLRARGDDPNQEIYLNLDNVPFVLNVIDVLVGDELFVDIRKRRPQHRTLEAIEARVEDALAVAKQKREGKQLELEQRINDLEQQVRAELAKITDPTSRRIKQEQAERRRNKLVQQYQRENQQELTQVERELESEIDSIKSFYKMWLVLVPPVLPLLMGLVVFINRRSRERMGVSSRRLRD